jgi:hypothetical protein
MHAFTGCDTVEALAGRGKLNALKLVKSEVCFQNTFGMLGGEWDVARELYEQLETFTCALYGSKTLTDVNKLRYTMFCAKKGNIESQQLPPCQDCLRKHILRANYQARVWRQCLIQRTDTPNPNGFGWTVSKETNVLSIDWMSGRPAPDAVLELLSCKCTRKCVVPKCPCKVNGLACTDMCSLQSCDNRAVPEEDDHTGVNSDSDDNYDEYNDDDD